MTRSRKLLSFFFLSFLIATIIDVTTELYVGVESVTFLPHTILAACFCFAWCKSHARENGIDIASGYPLGCAFFAVVGVPAYALAKFGVKRGMTITAKAVVFMLLAILVSWLIERLIVLVYVTSII
ncbi:hypothetical protein [Aliagarivorans marinus]|uniref:hypothetical protein n=1 Tax=Aliagarivorans marinus TaxID=561965 RepID=UPI00047C647F|nr:hypothetical protein [Aliagarivorans marinus]